MNHYSLIDSGDFFKLEQVGPFVLKRPAPAAVWPRLLPEKTWQKFDAEFIRKSDGKGNWQIKNQKLQKDFPVSLDGLSLNVSLTDFGHLGFFAEHATYWQMLTKTVQTIKKAQGECRILNLFAYTGAASLICAKAGAHVVHLDSSKTSVAWAKENAQLSGMDTLPIRWIVDDAKKFVAREVRRNSTYHGVILDPPSYGRGNGGEIWKIESDLAPMLSQISEMMDTKMGFVLLSSHSPGYTPLALKNILSACMTKQNARAKLTAEELVIAHKDSNYVLPSGAGCFYQYDI